MPKITPQQEEKIVLLRNQGLGYRLIAEKLGLSRDAVRYYCRQHHLERSDPDDSNSGEGKCCRQCGRVLPESPTGRKRAFCSDQCRWKWWHTHNDDGQRPSGSMETLSCPNCGKIFTVQKSKHRRYCSFDCYIRDRFWRLEDGREPYVSPNKK